MQTSLQTLTKKYTLTALVLAAGLLAGCANTLTSAPPATAEEIVSQRAQQYVDLVATRKYTEAYAYLTPSYRGLNTAEAYSGNFGTGARWIEPKVDKVECSTEERCVVTVKLKVSVVARGFTKPIDSTITETWLKEDGQWWFYQR